MPVLGGRFPHCYLLFSPKETGSERLQSLTADGWQKQPLTQVCLMPHLDSPLECQVVALPSPSHARYHCPSTPGLALHQTRGYQRSISALTLEAGLIQSFPLGQLQDYQDCLHQKRGDGTGQETAALPRAFVLHRPRVSFIAVLQWCRLAHFQLVSGQPSVITAPGWTTLP